MCTSRCETIWPQYTEGDKRHHVLHLRGEGQGQVLLKERRTRGSDTYLPAITYRNNLMIWRQKRIDVID